MNLCILSGKGGTGKTTVAVNLAVLMKTEYFDCDVEEPNGFIFLKPDSVLSAETLVDYPVIDPKKCTMCGQCVKACRYHALADTKKRVMLFPALCHGCGACSITCEQNAILYLKRSPGTIEKGTGFGIPCSRGILNVGENTAVPVIKHLLGTADSSRNTILDCAPGTSCHVVHTLRHADAAIIVTEPTVFGVHDMAMAAALLRKITIPFGVVINKSQSEDERIYTYCADNDIGVLGVIPFSKSAAEAYSRGQLLIELSGFRQVYEQIADRIKEVFLWN